MENSIQFNKKGHDAFIDFLKGVCIILVIITHCLDDELESLTLFQLWGRTAIPIFLIIQAFHVYKNGFEFRMPDFKKMWVRIIRPYLIIQIIIALMLLVVHPVLDFSDYIGHVSLMGGYGPGEYFPWVYCQFAIIIPMIGPIFKKFKPWQSLLLFIAASQIIEIACSLSHVSDWPYYSLSAGRYLFLIYLAYILVTRGLVVNKGTITLSILSLAATAYFCYSNRSLEPIFFCSTQWSYCHWVCYIYIAYLFLFGLKLLYLCIVKVPKLRKFIESIGRCSYEIYLFLMLYFAVMAYTVSFLMGQVVSNHLVFKLSIVIIAVVVSTAIPLLYMKIRKHWRAVLSNK